MRVTFLPPGGRLSCPESASKIAFAIKSSCIVGYLKIQKKILVEMRFETRRCVKMRLLPCYATDTAGELTLSPDLLAGFGKQANETEARDG